MSSSVIRHYLPSPSINDINRLWDSIGASKKAWQCKACGTVQYALLPHGHVCNGGQMKRFDINASTQEDLNSRFNYHAPNDDRKERHETVRNVLKTVAETICRTVPVGRERCLAITHLEEAMFWANAGIARESRWESPPPPHGGPAANDASTA